MQRLDRILLLRLLAIFGLILTVVTLSAVLSQAARLTDDVLRAGMSLSEFGGLILLIVPKMAELVTPLAFGIAVILACVQRNEAGTTLLLRAAGRAPRVDAGVIAGGSLAVALVLFACASVLVPLNQSQYRQAFALAQQQGIERLHLPVGQPVALVPGLSLQVEQHREAGVFEGVTVVDLTRPDERLIIRAERAALSRTGKLALSLQVTRAQVQQTKANGQTTTLAFASTVLPITLPDPHGLAAPMLTDRLTRADTLSSAALLGQIRAGNAPSALTAELTRRFAAALSVLAFGVLASGLLFARRPDGQRQTLPATALLVFLILYLLIQTTLLSARGFSPATGVLVLAISLSPPILAPVLQALIGLARRPATLS
ncbi:MAG: LptF/LptG family permease [Pseudomonadota bacterium]|nr:LptF/LptG family permease [Pseudomonadota bacterium]